MFVLIFERCDWIFEGILLSLTSTELVVVVKGQILLNTRDVSFCEVF